MKIGLYWTLGDFVHDASQELAARLMQNGVGLLELGMPFSDPLLDGPIIAASHHRVVASGYTFKNACDDLSAIAKLAKAMHPPVFISVMTASQLVYEESRRAVLAQADGILVTDISSHMECPFPLPAPRVFFVSQEVVLDPHFKSLPLEPISQVYLTRLQGITGEGQRASGKTQAAIAKLRDLTEAPIWVGFGISTLSDLEECHEAGADGGIIGSAFVRAMDEALQGVPEKNRKEHLLACAVNWCSQFKFSS